MTIFKITKALVLILAVSLSLQAQAKWHQAKGVGLNTDAAVNDAIHNLLLDSGADMRLEQVYKDGVLEGTHASVASKNPIRKLVVLERQSTLNRTTVTIKAFIEDRYAKDGISEWINNSDIITKQIIVSRNTYNYKGFSLFRYDYFFNDEKNNKQLVDEVFYVKNLLKG